MGLSKYRDFKEFESEYLSEPCPSCGAPMNAEDAYYYEKCSDCEITEHHRIKCWRLGADDDGLDKLFSTIKNEKH